MNQRSLLILFMLLVIRNVGSQEPSLPVGLGGATSDEPTFVMDEGSSMKEEEKEGGDEPFFDHVGFLDIRGGMRLQDDPVQKDYSLGEVRLHNEVSKTIGKYKFSASADLLFDPVRKDYDDTDLDKGVGLVDLREFNIAARPVEFMDLKIGRQVLTWGTGDLVFINDLFPKDWQSFFTGRDLTYLKAPSDALKASVFTPVADVDVIYTPWFDSDRFIDGSKISYLSPLTGQSTGRDTDFNVADEESGEIAVRIKKTVGSAELALYGYRGFWKSPAGINANGEFYFPELNVYGFSGRAPLWGGIANIEGGYYDSAEDSDGSNPMIPNDEIRLLAGYEHELFKDTVGSVQYYVESMQDYDNYRATLPSANKDQQRHMVTLKVRRDMWKQTLALTGMIFYSPTDQDGHYRLNLDYKMTDDTKLFVGVNGFYGEQNNTFWGQFENNTNAFIGATFNF